MNYLEKPNAPSRNFLTVEGQGDFMVTKKTLNIILATQLLTFCIASHADTCPWMFRLRGISVLPRASSSTIDLIGGHVTDINATIVPEFDINYFFTPNISSELILAITRHHARATGTALGKVDLGSVNLLPPTLTVLYHFLPNQMVNPYLGAGINYTYFYNASSGPGLDSISYGNSFGPALQVGADLVVNKNWSINFDAKKIYIETHARVRAGANTLTSDVKINPWVCGIGIGYKIV